jgi:hypothetical protein
VQIPTRTRTSGESVAFVAAAAARVPTEAASPVAPTEVAVRAIRTAGAATEVAATPAFAAISPAVSAAEPAKSSRIPMVHPLLFWKAGRP